MIGVIAGMLRMRGAPLPLKATEALRAEVERILSDNGFIPPPSMMLRWITSRR
jgi:hypothetical protein